MSTIDLNCDMGESFGAWKMGNDAELMKFVSSVSIACGFHAGDPGIIRKTIETALKNDVAIGAHPGFPDLQGFGRRDLDLSPQEVFDIMLYQISAVKGICEALGGKLRHVKPHGALYNQAANDKQLARAIAESVAAVDDSLILYGLSGSQLIAEAERAGLKTASEVFADRTYLADGSLTPRSEPNALIKDTGHASRQVMQMIRDQRVECIDGKTVDLTAETVCIHGDGENALEFARAIHQSLSECGIEIRSPG